MIRTLLYLSFSSFIFVSCQELNSKINPLTPLADNFTKEDIVTFNNTQLFLAQVQVLSDKEVLCTQIASKKRLTPKVKIYTDYVIQQRLGVCAALQLLSQPIPSTIPASTSLAPAHFLFPKTALKKFERSLMDTIIATHRKTIALLTDATRHDILLDVKVTINQALPRLQSDLKIAERVRYELL